MTERFKVTVLKTVVLERVPWVRIPLPPLEQVLTFGEVPEWPNGLAC